MEYHVIVERDPATKRFAVSVSGLPVFADARSEREAIELAREGIRFYLDEEGRGAERPTKAKVVAVKV